jgi:hypothetical protein
LIPNHTYIFKTAKRDWQNQQIWSEFIAYRIGSLSGIDLPPCFIAVDGHGDTGVLMEFFFGYPEEREVPRLVHASDYMTRFLVDRKKGRPHGIRQNIKICKALHVEQTIEWWGQVLVFDALIGNTDRHPDNWGFLVFQRSGLQPDFILAPAFDNGTSLGYEISQERLAALCEPSQLSAYIRRGKHHCGWDTAEDVPAAHMSLCERYLDAHPEAGAAMKNVIRFDVADVAAICDECTQFDVSVPFTRERAAFIVALIEARRAQLRALLGE